MITINEKLAMEAVDASIDFTRYNNGITKRIIALLNRADADLFNQITMALQRLPADSFTVERLDALLADVRRVNAAAYLQVRHSLETELKDLVAYESQYQYQLFTSMLPVQVSVAAISVDQVYTAALSRPMQSRLLKEWSASIEADKMTRIRDALRMGYVEGETIDQMVRRIRGTKAKGYEDGIIQIDRRNAQAVVRTATSHVSNFTRQRFYEENQSLIKGEKYIATIDGRTTIRCAGLDGQVFKPGTGPMPPQHWNCRSVRVPILKSWRELGIDMDELPESTRSSMDGQIPENMTYQQWLTKQSAERQDDILGVTKGKLFRQGGLTLDRFVDKSGKELNLTQLREKNAAAFAKAGL